MNNIIYLIGITGKEISHQGKKLLEHCDAVVAASRFSKLLPKGRQGKQLEQIAMTPLKDALDRMENVLENGNVAVLASGDPLFFGIGRTLCERFGRQRVQIYPEVSSMQLAFSRFKIPWDQARFISLHGRGQDLPVHSILSHSPTFLFTDQIWTPNNVCRELLNTAGPEIDSNYTVYVAEDLNSDEEKLSIGSLATIAEMEFSRLNVLIIEKNQQRGKDAVRQCSLGLREADIIHSRGLITKNEVRAAALHGLRLSNGGILWDVGAGSGSVGLEAARMFPGLQVFSIEKNSEQLENISQNRKKFQVWNLQVVAGKAPESLVDLPAPDAVFIGGSGGHLANIITTCADRLNNGGHLVVNAVIEKTALAAPKVMDKCSLQVTISELAVRRRNYPDGETVVMNPISIICGVKDKKHEEN